jgi:hypothetical protein
VFQAGGQYWIVNVGERDASTLRYFQYYYDGTVTVSAGSLSVAKTIAPYDGTASHYFIRNEQTKIIRKGYPVINITDAFKYAPNFVNNGNLKRPGTIGTTTVYYTWEKTISSTASVTATNAFGYNWIGMALGHATTIYVSPTSLAPVSSQDILTLSFLLQGYSSPSSTIPAVLVSVKLTSADGFDVYYLDNTNTRSTIDGNIVWLYNTVSCVYVTGRTSNDYETVSLTMPPCPIPGTLEIRFIQTSSTAVYISPTLGTCSFGNVILTAKSAFESRVVTGYYQRLSQYKKELSTTLGYDQVYNISLAGAMLRANAVYAQFPLAWTNWYRYGYSETFGNVPRLLIQQYINVQSIAQINMEGSVSSIFDSSGFISLLNTIVFTDATYFYSVSGKSYATGNATFDYIDDSLRATWLQINNTEVTTETITDYTLQKL